MDRSSEQESNGKHWAASSATAKSDWRLDHLTILVDASQDLILVVDSQHQIVNTNRAVERLLGFSKTDILGKDFHSLFAHHDPLLEPVQFVDGVAGPFEMLHRDGSIRFVEISAAFVPWHSVPALAYTIRDVTEHRRLEEERERLIVELQEALTKVKKLSGLLPMCASCKRIRDFQGYWEQVEAYISAPSEAEFSHSICPECRERLYPGLGQPKANRQTVVKEE